MEYMLGYDKNQLEMFMWLQVQLEYLTDKKVVRKNSAHLFSGSALFWVNTLNRW